MWKLIFSLLGCGSGEHRPSPRTYLKHGPAKWGENIGAKWGENEAEVLEIHFKKLGPIGAVQVMRLSANDCQGWENSNVIAPSSYQLLLFLLSLVDADGYLSVNYPWCWYTHHPWLILADRHTQYWIFESKSDGLWPNGSRQDRRVGTILRLFCPWRFFLAPTGARYATRCHYWSKAPTPHLVRQVSCIFMRKLTRGPVLYAALTWAMHRYNRIAEPIIDNHRKTLLAIIFRCASISTG